jgi:hypothetical protein
VQKLEGLMKCDEHDFHYYLTVNEAGWRCVNCDHKPGEPEGYSPQLDRENLYFKVHAVLSDLVMANLLHVSNSSHGDAIVAAVSDECQKQGLYDQESIALYILRGSQPSHAKYWKKVGDGVLAGSDPRDRCPCGALSTCASSRGGGGWKYRCNAHFGIDECSDIPGYQAQLFPEVPR